MHLCQSLPGTRTCCGIKGRGSALIFAIEVHSRFQQSDDFLTTSPAENARCVTLESPHHRVRGVSRRTLVCRSASDAVPRRHLELLHRHFCQSNDMHTRHRGVRRQYCPSMLWLTGREHLRFTGRVNVHTHTCIMYFRQRPRLQYCFLSCFDIFHLISVLITRCDCLTVLGCDKPVSLKQSLHTILLGARAKKSLSS
ncbi:hypothetical protein DFH11DRAFT_1071091 [Phellopilus nigrolimitatus]|nr:hypothetical protein DFH11DRAFT_1071091 [Phellopilus nigrolimitatus]